MGIDTTEVQPNPNGIAEQTIVSAQQVVVTPVSNQPVATTVAGQATLEATPDPMSFAGQAVQSIVSNPRELAIGMGGAFVVAVVVLIFSLYRWEVQGDPRAGEIVHAFGEPLHSVVFLLLGVCFQMARFAQAHGKINPSVKQQEVQP